jgi:hypothetical protein
MMLDIQGKAAVLPCFFAQDMNLSLCEKQQTSLTFFAFFS